MTAAYDAVYAYRVRRNKRAKNQGRRPYGDDSVVAEVGLFERGRQEVPSVLAPSEPSVIGYRVYRMESPRISQARAASDAVPRSDLRAVDTNENNTRRCWIVASTRSGRRAIRGAVWFERQYKKY